MKLAMRRKIEEVAQEWGINQEIILDFISEEWILPVDLDHQVLDEEDLARIQLIRELREDFGVNDEAMPIILHLVDQLNCLQREISNFTRLKNQTLDSRSEENKNFNH
jgi:chaperone modulatory protein CbpM